MAHDPERLAVARQKLIERADGALTVEEAAQLLGATTVEVRARIRRGMLVAYPTSVGDYLPRAQFAGDDVLPGLEEVLAAMHLQDPWMRFQLLLDNDVIGVLRDGRIQDAVRAVRTYLPDEQW